jgi:hypothetical protein
VSRLAEVAAAPPGSEKSLFRGSNPSTN